MNRLKIPILAFIFCFLSGCATAIPKQNVQNCHKIIPVSILIDRMAEKNLQSVSISTDTLIAGANKIFQDEGLNFQYQVSSVTLLSYEESDKFVEAIVEAINERSENKFREFLKKQELGKVTIYLIGNRKYFWRLAGYRTGGGALTGEISYLDSTVPNGYGAFFIFARSTDLVKLDLIRLIVHEQGHLFLGYGFFFRGSIHSMLPSDFMSGDVSSNEKKKFGWRSKKRINRILQEIKQVQCN